MGHLGPLPGAPAPVPSPSPPWGTGAGLSRALAAAAPFPFPCATGSGSAQSCGIRGEQLGVPNPMAKQPACSGHTPPGVLPTLLFHPGLLGSTHPCPLLHLPGSGGLFQEDWVHEVKGEEAWAGEVSLWSGPGGVEREGQTNALVQELKMTGGKRSECGH